MNILDVLGEVGLIVTFLIGVFTLGGFIVKYGGVLFSKISAGVFDNYEPSDENSPLNNRFKKLEEKILEIKNQCNEHDMEILDALRDNKSRMKRLEVADCRNEIISLMHHNENNKYDDLIKRLAGPYFDKGNNLLLLDDVNKSLKEPMLSHHAAHISNFHKNIQKEDEEFEK